MEAWGLVRERINEGREMKSKSLATVLFVVSVIAVILAILDTLGVGIWLMATTWLIIAAVLGIWAIYTDEG